MAIGVPSTAAFAAEQSVPAILAGVRAGRVFIDVEGTSRPDAEPYRLGRRTHRAHGRGDCRTPRQVLVFTIGVTGVDKGSVEIVSNMVVPRLGNRNIATGRGTIRMASRDAAGWVRINVRYAGGKLILIGNPI